MFPDPNELLDLRKENRDLRSFRVRADYFLRMLYDILREQKRPVPLGELLIAFPEVQEPLPESVTGPLRMAEGMYKTAQGG